MAQDSSNQIKDIGKKSNSMSPKSALDLIYFIEKIGAGDNSFSENIDELSFLYEVAVASKMPLFFLENLCQVQGESFVFMNELSVYRQRYDEMLDLAKETAKLFRNNQVDYVFFKTLRPFPSVGSDIDVLIFNQPLSQMLDYFHPKYKVLDACDDNLTLYSPLHRMKLDLHTSLSVSLFPYLDVDTLRGEIVERFIDEMPVNVLSQEAEVIITACHSTFKEQMLTLQDCYMFQYLLPSCDWNKIFLLLKKNNVKAAFELSTALTMYIFNEAGCSKFTSLVTEGLYDKVAKYEFARFANSSFILPYKYSAYSILLSFAERALLSRDGQKGTATFTRNLFKRAFMRRIVDRLPKHLQRTSY